MATFDQATADAIKRGDNDAVYVHAFVISSRVLSDDIRLLIGYSDVTMGGNLYRAYPIKPELPAITEKSNAVLRLTVDDVDSLIQQQAELASRSRDPISITYECWRYQNDGFHLASRYAVPMAVSNVSGDVTFTDEGTKEVLKIECRHVDFVGAKFGKKKYLASQYPGARA